MPFIVYRHMASISIHQHLRRTIVVANSKYLSRLRRPRRHRRRRRRRRSCYGRRRTFGEDATRLRAQVSFYKTNLWRGRGEGEGRGGERGIMHCSSGREDSPSRREDSPSGYEGYSSGCEGSPSGCREDGDGEHILRQHHHRRPRVSISISMAVSATGVSAPSSASIVDVWNKGQRLGIRRKRRRGGNDFVL